MTQKYKTQNIVNIGFKTEIKKSVEKDNVMSIKNKISSIINDNNTLYPKTISFAIVEYIHKKNYQSLEYDSLINYFTNQYRLDMNCLIGSSTKHIFSSESLLINSIKNIIKKNNSFAINNSHGKIYITLNLKNALKFLEKTCKNYKYIKKEPDTTSSLQNKITNNFSINEKNKNFDENVLLNKKRKNNDNLELDKEDTNNSLNLIDNKNKINEIHEYNKNIIEIKSISDDDNDDEEIINYDILNKQINKSFENLNIYYSQLTKIKSKLEFVQKINNILIEKHNKYKEGEKIKDNLIKDGTSLYKISFNEIKAIELFRKSQFYNNELIQKHLSILKLNDFKFNKSIELFNQQISYLNKTKIEIEEEKRKLNKGLNEIIEIYNSPNLNKLFKDIIGKELFEILKKRCYNINQKIKCEKNNTMDTKNETIKSLKYKFENIKLKYEEFEKNEKKID